MWRLALFLLVIPAFALAATPDWSGIFRDYEQQYGLPEGVLARIARAESGFRLQARNPGSSAYGPFQWLSTSWLYASRAKYGRAVDLEKRADASISAEVTAFSLAQALTQLRPQMTAAGVDLTTGLYMSHFLGTGGARQFFRAMAENPAGSAAAAFPKAAASNRPIFYDGGRARSFSEIIQLMSKKLGIESAAPVVPFTGATTDTRGVPLSRSPDDLRPSDFVPDSSIPRNDTERDYPTTYTPAAGTGSESPRGNLLGNPMPQLSPPPLAQPQIASPVRMDMLFGGSSSPPYIVPTSRAKQVLSSITVETGAKAPRIPLREELRQQTSVLTSPRPRTTEAPAAIPVRPGVPVAAFGSSPTDEPTLAFLQNAVEALRGFLEWLLR